MIPLILGNPLKQSNQWCNQQPVIPNNNLNMDIENKEAAIEFRYQNILRHNYCGPALSLEFLISTTYWYLIFWKIDFQSQMQYQIKCV